MPTHGDQQGRSHANLLKNHLSLDTCVFLVTLLAVLSALIVIFLKTDMGNYSLDDAYIVEHSVKGILAGYESRFLDATQWDGVTSPIYVFSIAFLSLFMPIAFAHWIISTISTLTLVAGWYLLGRKYKLNSILIMCVIWVTLLSGMTYYQLTNGLETGMAMAAFTWMLIAIDAEQPPNWSYALAGLQCFIRPELAALSAIFALYVISKRPLGWKKGALITLGAFSIPLVAWFLSSGVLIPNTLSAKTYFFAEGCRSDTFKSKFTLSALKTFIISLGIFSAGFIMALASRFYLVLLSFFAIFVFAYFERFPGALFHNYSRYCYLLLPIAVIGWATCLGHKNNLVRYITLALGITTAVYTLGSAKSDFVAYIDGVNNIANDNAEMSQWVAKHVPSDAVVMVHDAGMVSLFGEQPLVDLVGLKTSYSVDVHRRTTFARCQRIASSISYIAKYYKASYLVVTEGWDKIFGLTQSLKLTGWHVERADGIRGKSVYQVFKITDSKPHVSF